jgi:hypothetical protein
MNKQLYLLHIPKVGGTSVTAVVRSHLDNRGLGCYPNNFKPPHPKNFDGYAFIDSHLGLYPTLVNPGIEVACLVREPVGRAVSNFLWIYNSIIIKNEKYMEIDSVENRLKHYLFNDESYSSHKNIQTRFICNSLEDRAIDQSFTDYTYEEYSKTWFIKNENTSVEKAMQNIDNFSIVGTTCEHKQFVEKVVGWYRNEYKIGIPSDNTEYMQFTDLNIENQKYTTKLLSETLTKNEKSRIIEDNYMDYEIYEYIKAL